MAKTTTRPELDKNAWRNKNTQGNLSFPTSPVPHSVLFVFKDYDFKTALGGGLNASSERVGQRAVGSELRSINSIELPFPTTLQDDTNLRINGFERNKTTEYLATAAREFAASGNFGNSKVSDLPQLLMSLGAGMGRNAPEDMSINAAGSAIMGSSLADTAKSAQYLLRSKLPGDIGRTLDTVQGNTVNPRETLSFEGVDLRTHNMTFDLYPTNKSDSILIKKIVERFKQKTLPVARDFAGLTQAFLSYPSTVDIFLLGIDPTHWMQYKTSMVTQFTVNYQVGGLTSIMKGGKPSAVQIALTFQELEIQTANDYGVSAGADANAVGET